VIDVPGMVAGGTQLGALITEAVGSGGRPVIVMDEAGLQRLARAAAATAVEPSAPRSPVARHRARVRPGAWVATAGILAALLAAAVSAVAGKDTRRTPITQTAPPAVLVEGRVALTIPAGWLAQRVVVGPGSARVQVTSPVDAEVALHVTQSPTPGETLAGAADRLKRAIDAQPPGVFVDFNPSGISAGRPAVTYREVRRAHDVRWTVLLDGSVRISIGCQSRPGTQDAVRAACEEAVRSAHALD
jgi:type VII secretion-associated protein (TIGR03931 family)